MRRPGPINHLVRGMRMQTPAAVTRAAMMSTDKTVSGDFCQRGLSYW
jgi:hypothetical protein